MILMPINRNFLIDRKKRNLMFPPVLRRGICVICRNKGIKAIKLRIGIGVVKIFQKESALLFQRRQYAKKEIPLRENLQNRTVNILLRYAEVNTDLLDPGAGRNEVLRALRRQFSDIDAILRIVPHPLRLIRAGNCPHKLANDVLCQNLAIGGHLQSHSLPCASRFLSWFLYEVFTPPPSSAEGDPYRSTPPLEQKESRSVHLLPVCRQYKRDLHFS